MSCVEEKNDRITALKKNHFPIGEPIPGVDSIKNPEHDSKTKI